VCVLIYLAVTSHWTYSLAIVGLLLFWGLISQIRTRSLHRKDIDALRAAFSAPGMCIPRLEEGGGHGWSTFGLVFASASELKLAEESGCIAAFKQAIQQLHGHEGSKENPFDADRAVWAEYEGQY